MKRIFDYHSDEDNDIELELVAREIKNTVLRKSEFLIRNSLVNHEVYL